MKADRCLYALFAMRNGELTLIGLAGIHVDDFLLSGDGSPEFLEAEKKLQAAFRWGKWDQDEFDFAGTPHCPALRQVHHYEPEGLHRAVD